MEEILWTVGMSSLKIMWELYEFKKHHQPTDTAVDSLEYILRHGASMHRITIDNYRDILLGFVAAHANVTNIYTTFNNVDWCPLGLAASNSNCLGAKMIERVSSFRDRKNFSVNRYFGYGEKHAHEMTAFSNSLKAFHSEKRGVCHNFSVCDDVFNNNVTFMTHNGARIFFEKAVFTSSPQTGYFALFMGRFWKDGAQHPIRYLIPERDENYGTLHTQCIALFGKSQNNIRLIA